MLGFTHASATGRDVSHKEGKAVHVEPSWGGGGATRPWAVRHLWRAVARPPGAAQSLADPPGSHGLLGEDGHELLGASLRGRQPHSRSGRHRASETQVAAVPRLFQQIKLMNLKFYFSRLKTKTGSVISF